MNGNNNKRKVQTMIKQIIVTMDLLRGAHAPTAEEVANAVYQSANLGTFRNVTAQYVTPSTNNNRKA